MKIIEQKRAAYNNFAILNIALKKYAIQENKYTTEKLKALAILNFKGMPLPSGRYGNVLAVALEMQQYKGALFLMKNAKELEINLNVVSSKYGGENIWNVKQVFEASLEGFDTIRITENDECYKEYPNIIKEKNNNIDAVAEIELFLQKDFEREDTTGKKNNENQIYKPNVAYLEDNSPKIIKKIRLCKEKVLKREKIIPIAIATLGMVCVVGINVIHNQFNKNDNENVQQIKELASIQENEKKFNLLSYQVLVENCPDGSVKHHFVNKNNWTQSIARKQTENYYRRKYKYTAITDNNFIVSYSELTYETANYYQFKEIPKTEGQYIFDYNVPFYVMDVTDLSLPEGYSFDKEYSLLEVKELEEKLDASIYEKKNQNYRINRLVLIQVNGTFMCFDLTNLPIQVDETTDKEDVTKLRTVYYFPSVENNLANLKLSSGMTKVEEDINDYNYSYRNFAFEDITFLDQTIRNDLRGNIIQTKNISDYLTEEQINNRTITSEEIVEVLEQLNNQDRLTR